MTVAVTVTVTVAEHIPNTIYIFIYNTYVQINNSPKEVLIKLHAEKCNKVIDKRRLVRYNYNIIKKDIKQRKGSSLMKVKVKVYDGVKYWDGTQKVVEVNYDIQGYEVKQIPDEEIAAMGFDTVDEFEEYLILTLKSGETSTFCNSHVDLFKV